MKPIRHGSFSADYPIKGIVWFHLNPDPIEDLESYAQGYHQAAKTLAARMRRSRHPRHFDGFPVLFLYRHALELYLKAVICAGSRLLFVRDSAAVDLGDLLKNHGIVKCVAILKRVLIDLGWIDGFMTRGIRSFQELEKLAAKIDAIDAGSYAFRYPINTKGTRALPRGFTMNALAFSKALDPVLDFLDASIFAVDHEVGQFLDNP
jgi:hypothetical protein